jgi:hypothetical protein
MSALARTLRLSFAAVFVLAAGCAASDTEEEQGDSDESAVQIAADKREQAVAKADVWDEAEFAKLATKNLARGQEFANAPIPGEEIVCKFVEPTEKGEFGGKTEKFKCGPCELTPAEISAGKKPCNITKKLKVKYSGIGRDAKVTDPAAIAREKAEDVTMNPEVFAEPVGTRLMWSLGFYADGIYPVKVTCYGCPEKPWDTYSKFPSQAGGARADRRFHYGAIEIKMPGEKIETTADQGFDFGKESGKIDPAKGGSPREQVEAWKLLAAFMHHGDSKAANQRLVCPKDALAADGTCSAPRAMIQDIGAGFGSEGKFLGLGYKKAALNAWIKQPIWKDLSKCQANLSTIYSLENPVVTEAGRAFLARLLDPSQLTDAKLTEIFTVARIAEQGEMITDSSGRERLVTVADWVYVFNQKRAEVAKPCGGR